MLILILLIKYWQSNVMYNQYDNKYLIIIFEFLVAGSGVALKRKIIILT